MRRVRRAQLEFRTVHRFPFRHCGFATFLLIGSTAERSLYVPTATAAPKAATMEYFTKQEQCKTNASYLSR
jgi:hypothetical protein